MVASNAPGAASLRVLVAAGTTARSSSLADVVHRGGFAVVATASDEADAVASARCLQPHVCVLAADLPGSAIVATARIVGQVPGARVVVAAPVADDDDCLSFLLAGASAYVGGADGADALVDAVHAAAADRIAIPAVVQARLVDALRRDIDAGHRSWER